MEVSPSVLEFTGSFQQQTTETLTLTNTSSKPLAFKVKTTAPKLYCVRPNASLLNPGESLDISVILQGFSQPLPSDYKCKDKFLLVSLPAPELSDASSVADFWPSLENKYKSQMISKKLKVNYRITREIDQVSDSGVDYHHNQQQQQQQQQQQHNIQTADSSMVEPVSSMDYNGYERVYHEPAMNNLRDLSEPVVHATPPPARVEQRPTPPQQASPELQRELAMLAQQVKTLSAKLDENEKASVAAAANLAVPSHSARVEQMDPINGISLPIALVLIFMSFIIGWLIT